MQKRVLSLIVALLVTVTAFILYQFSVWLYITAFPRRYLDEPRLAIAICVTAASVWFVSHRRDLPAWMLLIGSSAFLAVSLHDCFVDYGLQYHWFQFGGTDGWVFQGFFEPRENPLIAVPAHILRYVSLLTYAGIFWLAAQTAQQHLTKRWSERPPGLAPHLP